MISESKNSNLVNRFLIFSLIWIIIEGVLRKWIFPSLSSQIFVLKYVFFTITYLLYYLQHLRFHKIKTTYEFLIVVLTSWCIFQFVNDPYKSPLLVKAFGLIIYLFFIPLIFILPSYFKSIIQFEKLVKFLAYISIPIFILGIIQYYLPPDHFLNSLVNDEQKYTTVESFTRSLSIFTFVKIYAVYLLFTLTVFIGYIYYLSAQRKSIWFYVTLLIFGILNLIMTASRLQIFALSFNALIISLFAFIFIVRLRKHVIFILSSGLILALILYFSTESFQVSTDAFVNRIRFTERAAAEGLEGWSTEDRVFDRVNIFIFSEQAGWFGLGIGTTYQGTGNFLSKHFKEGYEEEGERIVLELGVIGGIIMILLRMSILFYGIKVLVQMKHINYFLLTLPLVLYLFPPAFFISNLTFNYFDGFSYWLCFGLIVSLEKIYINQLNTSE